MEICGGQTHAIVKFGLDELLPPSLTLVHGPGCPVCVTSAELIDQAVDLALRHGAIVCSFGDMLRVPGNGIDLLTAKARGGDVRIVYSPLDAVTIVQNGAIQTSATGISGSRGNGAGAVSITSNATITGLKTFASGISAKGKIAIEGRSNGGLLVGASLNQRPDLFAAGHAAVGVMDMVRFDRFTAGRYWVDDYGYPSKEADFKMQMTYSPYHNVKSGVEYPAVIVSTADTDDRVVPGHSFKYTARLQATEAGDKPHLIRIETRAGHGSGKPTDKQIEEYSDMYAFIAHFKRDYEQPLKEIFE